jgi:uncharacterized membrane protein YedE/YeeE
MIDTKDGGWNPYLAGALTGLLLIFSVWAADKYVGASTTFVKVAGIIENQAVPERVAELDYFKKEKPGVDWQTFFVAGILIGAFISSSTSGSFKLQGTPDMWRERFGPGIPKRAAVAFIGGFIAIMGARLADGCPSGHGLSGSLQLAVSGLISLCCFFIGGMITARIVYGGKK